MPAPALYASDTFNRADTPTAIGNSDGPSSLAWTAQFGNWGIASNKGYCSSAGADVSNGATLSVAQANVSTACDVTLSATSNRALAGFFLRFADFNNCLRVILCQSTAAPDQIQLAQIVAGVTTVLGSVSTAGLTNGSTYNLKSVISGTTINVVVDGVERVAPQSFNAGLTTQKYGLIVLTGATFDDGGSRFDNFRVSAIEMGASSVTAQAVKRAGFF